MSNDHVNKTVLAGLLRGELWLVNFHHVVQIVQPESTTRLGLRD